MKISVPRVWREIKSHYLLEASVCMKCGKIHYPPRTICDNCKNHKLIKRKLSGEGEILTYTVQYVVLEGYREYAPIIFAIVKLKEGVNVLAPLTDVKPENVRVGMKVTAVLRKIAEDEDLGLIKYGIKFKPMKEFRSEENVTYESGKRTRKNS